MTTASTAAPIAHAFDPAAWLAQFEAVGGGYILNVFRLSLVYQIAGVAPEDQRTACRLVNDLSETDRETLIAHLRALTAAREA